MDSETADERGFPGGTTSRRDGVVGAVAERLSVYSLASIAALVLLWEAVSRSRRLLLGSPVETALAWIDLTRTGVLPVALLDSLQHMLLGYALAVVLAVPIGLAMGRSKVFRWMVDPYVDALYATPMIAYVPLIIVWFGLGFRARVFVVFTFCFFEILVITYQGALAIDPEYYLVGRSFDLSWWERQRRILLPASLPFVYSGLRIGIGRAVRGMIVAELFLAVVNLGALLERAAGDFDTATQIAVILTVTVLGVGLQKIVLLLESALVPWHRVDRGGE